MQYSLLHRANDLVFYTINKFYGKLFLNVTFAFLLLVLGVDILPPVQSINSAESVSFPGENKQAGNINLPASLMWRAQQQGSDLNTYDLQHTVVSMFCFTRTLAP